MAREAALPHLRAAAATLAGPVPRDYDALADWLVQHAVQLNDEARRKVRAAFRIGGYNGHPVAEVVPNLLELADRHADAIDSKPSAGP
jgi:hypothetical protein